MRRREEPKIISGVIDFLRVLKPWFEQTKGMKLLRQDPFAKFDREYAKYKKLEKELEKFESKKKENSEIIDRVFYNGSWNV